MADLTVSIMQPYFFPYAGYFRLFAASDLFVIYDCVQFPRRGWVHRNKLIDTSGEPRWLTLPLEKARQDVLIRDLRFPPNAAEELAERLRPFPLTVAATPDTEHIVAALRDVRGTPLEYIERLLELTVGYCDLPWRTVRSSTLGVPPEIRGQDRIVEIARRLGATCYVNASGGRDLYDAAAFDKTGIELRFLAEYQGPTASILQRMLTDNRGELVRDIANSSVTA
jgi:hypothetical protein